MEKWGWDVCFTTMIFLGKGELVSKPTSTTPCLGCLSTFDNLQATMTDKGELLWIIISKVITTKEYPM